ncbi:MAG: SDR family NAD(P)-dependent oxidoreductase [Deltaproteobacteria bacterium]|nr:SDR family NAD(P)-dependent oxidoreductase [Deltaproteobacteria bacterium]MBW2154555.1 SDR family NAD(P)-dependent oxidoreductase [Deltaproteobacteria bacterium]
MDRVDILVNNAGVNHRMPVLEFPEEEWDLIINTNLKKR